MCSRWVLVSLLGYMVEGVPLERAPKSPDLLHHSPGGRRGSNWTTVHGDKTGSSGQSRALVLVPAPGPFTSLDRSPPLTEPQFLQLHNKRFRLHNSAPAFQDFKI